MKNERDWRKVVGVVIHHHQDFVWNMNKKKGEKDRKEMKRT